MASVFLLKTAVAKEEVILEGLLLGISSSKSAKWTDPRGRVATNQSPACIRLEQQCFYPKKNQCSHLESINL